MFGVEFFTDQEISYILSDAPAAITYWADGIMVYKDAIGFKVSDGGIRNNLQYRVYPRSLQDAAEKIIVGRLANDEILSQVATRNFDLIMIDVLIQVAAFGEIKFS